MLGWLKKDPLKVLGQEHAKLLKAATDLQRKGDIVAYSDKMAEAEAVLKEIEKLEAAGS